MGGSLSMLWPAYIYFLKSRKSEIGEYSVFWEWIQEIPNISKYKVLPDKIDPKEVN